jgi:hypothetical protein
LWAPLLAALLAGCFEEPVGREEYVRIWSAATLRAREKGTEPREEVDKILAVQSIELQTFRDAQVRWFGEETSLAVRREVRSVLETPKLPSRMDYVQARVKAYLRSRLLGTRFRDEIRRLAPRFGFSPEGFRMAERIWVGDAETDGEIRKEFERLRGAIDLGRPVWEAAVYDPRFGTEPAETWLWDFLEENTGRPVDPADWRALEELLGE